MGDPGAEYAALLARAAPFLRPREAADNEAGYGRVAVAGDEWLRARATVLLRDGLPELPLDDDARVAALIVALAELDLELGEEALRAWDPGKHPRGPGGRFRATVDVLKDAVTKHRETGTGDPFDGYDREQLRRVARARGIELQRGESRDSIAAKLLADLGGGAPARKTPAKKSTKTETRLVRLRPETRRAVTAAVRALPKDADGWRDVVQQRRERMRITEELGDARRDYRDAVTNRTSSQAVLVAAVGRTDPRVDTWATLQRYHPELAEDWEAHEGVAFTERVDELRAKLDKLRDAYDLATDQIAALGGMKANGDLPDGFRAPPGFHADDFRTLVTWQQRSYPRDIAGVPVPPPELVKMHDAVQRAGEAIHADVKQAIDADPELLRLTKDRGRASAERWLPGASAADRAAALTRIVEINQLMARRERELVKDALDQLRPIGGAKLTNVKPVTTAHDVAMLPGDVTGLVPARADWQAHFVETSAHMPDDWVRRANTVELQVAASARAYHQSNSVDWRRPARGEPMLMAMSNGDRAYGGAFASYASEVTFHETGHHMEALVPGLKALEFAYVRSRTTHGGIVEPTVRMADLQGGGYESYEVAYKDEFPNAYTGRTYELSTGDPANAPWEAFQVGLQQTFGRQQYARYGDDTLEHFVLGVMATLGRS